MNKLVTDKFVRTTVQCLLLAFLLVLALICLLFVCFVLSRQHGAGLTDNAFVVAFFSALKVPFQDNFAPFIVVFGGLIPVVFTSVCFKADAGAVPPTVTPDLNRVGHTVIILMVFGLVAGATAILLFSTNADAIDYLVSGSANREAVRGLIAAILSFQAVYFAQLLGLQPK